MEFQLDRSKLDPETRAQLETSEAALREKPEEKPDYNIRILQDWIGRHLTSLSGALEMLSLDPSDKPITADAAEVQRIQNDVLQIVPELRDSTGQTYNEVFGGNLAANIDRRLLSYLDQLVQEVRHITEQHTTASAQSDALWRMIERVRQIKSVEQIPVIN